MRKKFRKLLIVKSIEDLGALRTAYLGFLAFEKNSLRRAMFADRLRAIDAELVARGRHGRAAEGIAQK